MNKGQIIAQFLVSLARKVEQLSEEELELLLHDGALAGLLRQRTNYSSAKAKQPEDVQRQAESLMADLANRATREEATNFLSELSPSKRVLSAAAKMRQVHVLKQDTVAVISRKLVENVVGSRLDSARIRGG